MRQHVPELDRNLSNDEFLDLIVDCFHSVIFGTVDQNGDPHTNIIDIDFNEDGRLILQRLIRSHFIAILRDTIKFQLPLCAEEKLSLALVSL